MPRPIARSNTGMYHLNVRVPSDLAARLRTARVTLPIGVNQVTVVVTDKVAVSLRTKDPTLAKARFALAYAALARHFDAVRAGPTPLTHRQAVALAGEAYRRRAGRFESDASCTPAAMEAERRQRDIDIAAWAAPETVTSAEDGEVTLPPLCRDDAKLLAALQRPSGPQLLAWETGADVDTGLVRMSHDDALAHLFGDEADAICAGKGLVIDEASRTMLLREIGAAVHDVARKVTRNIGGDYAPDLAASRFPAFEPSARAELTKPDKAGTGETLEALFARWKAKLAGKTAASTVRRYEPSVVRLGAFVKGRDWRLITAADVHAWAVRRHEVDGVAAATVNRNDLVAVASVLGWATMENGRRMPANNPAFGVKIEAGRKRILRERLFRMEEVIAILTLARSVQPSRRYRRAAASRRWCPWLCAYSGARVQETLWLKRTDVRREAGLDVMHFPRTKDGIARVVPIHAALVKEGFLDFVATAPDGFLFVGDKPQKEGASRTMQEIRAAELAAWLQRKIGLEAGVSPNHGWRHTWVTIAESAGIPPRLSNRITGHNMGDVSGRYVGSLVTSLAAEMAKFPEYDLKSCG